MNWNFSAWSIRNPVAPILLFIVLTALGLMSFATLPITRFPNIDVPLVSVSVTDPGVAPSELETQVTKRIEDAVANISGVKNVMSTITEGNSQTTVEFRLEVTPPPQANFGAFPSDPSIFDQVQFQDFSFDPAGIGFEPPQWRFGNGATGSGFFPTHRYAADGDYLVEETVTTLDGRSASTSRTLQVRTRDVAITRFQAPVSTR